MIKLGEFSRNVLVILTGTVAAQAITVLVSPVLTRLYSPEDFGVYALFVSVVMLVGPIVCGRYDMSITLPLESRHGLALLGLSTLVALGIALVLIPAVALCGDAAVAALKEPRLRPWLWVLPVTLAATGFTMGARYWLLRTKSFGTVSANGILRSALAAACNLLFGVLGWLQFGLIGGFVAGLLVSAIFLAIRIWRDSGAEIRQLRWRDIREQAHAQHRFPVYSLGSALVESGAGQVPVFFFSSLFGAATLGLFSLAQRIANLPLTLVASSIGDVFRQQASAIYAQEGNCRALFARTFHQLFWSSLPAFAAAAVFSPWLFATVFGPGWGESGEFVRCLAPALALRFVSSPLSSMFYIAQRQDADLMIQAALVAIMAGLFLFAGQAGWTPRQAILGYSAVYSSKYLLELGLSWRFAAGAKR